MIAVHSSSSRGAHVPRLKSCCISSVADARLAINAGAAVVTVRPYGVDLCSGVREQGRLSATKLAAFVQAARASARPAPSDG